MSPKNEPKTASDARQVNPRGCLLSLDLGHNGARRRGVQGAHPAATNLEVNEVAHPTPAKVETVGIPPILEGGAPWPAIERPGDAFVDADDGNWVSMTGYPGSAVKVLYADRDTNTAAFLYRLGPNQNFPMHEHRCRAFAYTIEGKWNYGDTHLREGSLAVEQVGSTHFPQTRETGFTVFTLLVEEPGETVLLRSQDPELLELAELGIDYFIDLMRTGA